jgi:predicted CXXCH cytochrome family protein
MRIPSTTSSMQPFLMRGWLTALVVVIAFACRPAQGQITNTKHDLSKNSTGASIKSTTETEICRFCHVPHNAVMRVPLWGHDTSAATYTAYTSNTLTNTVSTTVGGATKLCLSCHDGQVAVNALGPLKTAPTMSGTTTKITGGSSVGTDLSDDHPVSFLMSSSGNSELTKPTSKSHLTGEAHLDDNGYMQCTSCHDPHKSNADQTCSKFLVASNSASAVCTKCHTKTYWSSSSHQASTETFTTGQGQHTGYTTIATNGCESCHKPHAAGQALHILNGKEEATCTPCHKGSKNGGNTKVNISDGNSGPYTKTYTHPTFSTSGKHSPRVLSPRTENPGENTDDLKGTSRHAECADCHNPHAAATRSGSSGSHYNGTFPTADVSQSKDLTGVWGVEPATTNAWTVPTQANYSRVDPSTQEYQICYKCHSSYAYGTSPPTSPSSGQNGITSETDQAMEFNSANASYHGVAAAPLNTVKGYYTGPWGNTSRMYCSDCHLDNDANTGWTVPAVSGTHGSTNPFILRGAWDNTTGKNKQSHLCFRCHDYNGFSQGNAAKTRFSGSNYTEDLHKKHVDDEGKPCMACHVAIPHGWNRTSMIVLVNDGAPYEVVGTAKLKTITYKSGNYRMADCSTGTGCH